MGMDGLKDPADAHLKWFMYVLAGTLLGIWDQRRTDMTTIVLIIILLLLFGGGG